MKEGLQEGQSVEITVKVTPDMFAQFEGHVIHRVYSTVAMVYHMELGSRKLILPYLHENEEGMGSAVSVEHFAPSPEGSVISVKATVSKIVNNTVTSIVIVKNEKGIIGRGEVRQVILPKSKINEMTSFR